MLPAVVISLFLIWFWWTGGPEFSGFRRMPTSMWLCCFCGGEIEEQPPEPVKLIAYTSPDDKPQFYACHAECFKERLATDPPIFQPKHF